MEIRPELRYTKDHEWVRREGDDVIMGISDYAQEQLTDIVYVELPEVGAALTVGEPFGSVEAVKAVADMYAPVDGEVVAVNEGLADDPMLVNRSAYDDGWMVRVKLSDAAQLDALLSAEEYQALVRELGGAPE
jgi:glycine cleavage system H protein